MKLQPLLAVLIACLSVGGLRAADYSVMETDDAIHITTPLLEATIAKTGYVTGIKRQTLLDKTTGFRDPGYGLDIIDWIMEPGSDMAYRDRLDPELVPLFCEPCGVAYCWDHWTLWDEFDPDDSAWYDETRGRCPKDHERRVYD